MRISIWDVTRSADSQNSQDYMCVVLGIVVVLAVVNWTLYARSEYGGPKVVLLETPQGTVKSDKEHSGDSSESSDA